MAPFDAGLDQLTSTYINCPSFLTDRTHASIDVASHIFLFSSNQPHVSPHCPLHSGSSSAEGRLPCPGPPFLVSIHAEKTSLHGMRPVVMLLQECTSTDDRHQHFRYLTLTISARSQPRCKTIGSLCGPHLTNPDISVPSAQEKKGHSQLISSVKVSRLRPPWNTQSN